MSKTDKIAHFPVETRFTPVVGIAALRAQCDINLRKQMQCQEYIAR